MQRAANAWDRFYRRHEAPWRGERPVEELLPWLGPGPVLELGCGNGKLLRPLRAAGVDAIGLDVSWHALRRHADHGALVLADAAALPFLDGSFSAVLDVHCTGHLPADARSGALRECLRVLRPGGAAVAERLTPSDLRASQGEPDPHEPGRRRVADGRATRFSTLEELTSEYCAAGFDVLSGALERHHPGHRGRLVTRESARILAVRPALPTGS